MTYTVNVYKPCPRNPKGGQMVPHSHTPLDVSLGDAEKTVRIMREGLPSGFLVELQDANGRTVKVL
jgi:hypothetical protein